MSAQYMPRAVGCFRAVDFAVEAYPVAWRSDPRLSLWPSFTVGANLARLDNVAREWLGLVAYRLTGRTSALLPAP